MDQLNNLQYIEVGIGSEKYAISIFDLQEIIRLPEITHIPNMEEHILGVINLRGKIIPVISFCKLFKIRETESTKQSRIVVVRFNDESIGIWVDRVTRVAKYAIIQSPSEHLHQSLSGILSGIGQSDEGLVGIINLELILSELRKHEYV